MDDDEKEKVQEEGLLEHSSIKYELLLQALLGDTTCSIKIIEPTKEIRTMKIIFFDVETTGLDPKVHGIHQLAGEIVIADEVVDRFDYRIDPFDGCIIDKQALAVSNTTNLDLMRYSKEFKIHYMIDSLIQKYLDFNDKKDKFYLAGWRAPEFDVKFLKAFFDRNYFLKDTFDSYFWSNSIDVKVLATQYLIEQRPEMPHFHLVDVAKYLGVSVNESKLHSAAYDAYLCRKVYEILPKCTLGKFQLDDVDVENEGLIKLINEE